MIFKYCAITANCGNDKLGDSATDAIKKLLEENELDFCVINAQEVDFNKTLRELQLAVGVNYTVIRAGGMVTRTKVDDLNVMSGNTGMASFVICKQGITVQVDASHEARRDPSKFYGTALNKGGIISHCTLIDTKSNEQLNLQLVSGHLDSNKTMERAKDWGVILSKLAKPSSDVQSFANLIEMIPDIRLSGYDANTRNKVSDETSVNMWTTDSYELEGFKQAPLGNRRFSAASTYKSDVENIETDKAEGKRLGYTKGGMLDFVDVMDGQKHDSIIQHVRVIDPGDPTTKRDHAVVISDVLNSVSHSSQFDKVKNQMSAMLMQSAPVLSSDLRKLSETESNKKMLVDIYQQFLSQEGLLIKEFQLFTEKLNVIKKASKSGADSEMEVSNTLFKTKEPWFENVNITNYKEQALLIAEKQKMMSIFIKQVVPNENRSRSSSPTGSLDSMESELSSLLPVKSARHDEFRGLSKSAPPSPIGNTFRSLNSGSEPSSPQSSLRSRYTDFVTRFKPVKPPEKSTDEQDKSVENETFNPLIKRD